MRAVRFPIARLMWAVLVVALALAALRDEGMMFLVTGALLLLAIAGAVCRAGASRAWWLGFALFGWGYIALEFCSSTLELPTTPLLAWIQTRLGYSPRFPAGFGGAVRISAGPRAGIARSLVCRHRLLPLWVACGALGRGPVQIALRRPKATGRESFPSFTSASP